MTIRGFELGETQTLLMDRRPPCVRRTDRSTIIWWESPPSEADLVPLESRKTGGTPGSDIEPSDTACRVPVS
jgi:hypothetical protein